jgi:adenosylcobinamide kinase/adenosylcobinamide-phosphate guanylyltransferase
LLRLIRAATKVGSPNAFRGVDEFVSTEWRKTLVLGGARSGKSGFAEALGETIKADLVYIATAEVRDVEMAQRIDLHRSSRSTRWRTVEAPISLPDAIAETAGPDAIVLVDCLTIWLSNIMLSNTPVDDAEGRLAAAVANAPGRIILVSNEVGLGIVPDNALARRFRDAQGRLNQRMARHADLVVFVAAGLPLYLKGGAPAS